MILCAQCGVGAEPGQNFCLNCGQPMRTAAAPTVQLPGSPFGSAPGVTAPHGFPQVVPRKSRSHLTLLVAGWLAIAAVSLVITLAVLHYRRGDPVANSSSPPPIRITATASSTKAPGASVTYWAANVLDGNLATAWVEGVNGSGIGEWIRLDFDREVALSRVLLTPGYFKSANLWAHNNRLAAATFYFSDGSSRRFDFSDRMEEQSLELGGIKTRWVRMTIDSIFAGSVDSEDTPVSELTFVYVQ